MKAADGWLHALSVPLECIEALFEHVPQILGLLVLGIAPLIITGCAICCIWTRRQKLLNCCRDTESVQTSNYISNQLSNQISNQKVGGSGSLLPRPKENFYEATSSARNAPPAPTTINIQNNNVSSQQYPQPMMPNPDCGQKPTAQWSNEFQAMFQQCLMSMQPSNITTTTSGGTGTQGNPTSAEG
jgi:hypothetical protein